MRRAVLFSLVLAAIVSGCAPVERHASVRQAVGATLTAYPGALVVRVDKTRDLPNLWGRADAFGRQIDEGFVEVRYLGLEGDRILLDVVETNISSNESVASRTGPIYSSNPRNPIVFIPPVATTVVGPNSESRVVWDPKDGPFTIPGCRIVALQTSSTGLTYRLEQ